MDNLNKLSLNYINIENNVKLPILTSNQTLPTKKKIKKKKLLNELNNNCKVYLLRSRNNKKKDAQNNSSEKLNVRNLRSNKRKTVVNVDSIDIKKKCAKN